MGKNNVKRVVVGDEEKRKALDEFHRGFSGGHFGRNGVMYLIFPIATPFTPSSSPWGIYPVPSPWTGGQLSPVKFAHK